MTGDAGKNGRTGPEARRGLLLSETVIIEMRILQRIELLQRRLSSERSGAVPQARQNHKAGHRHPMKKSS